MPARQRVFISAVAVEQWLAGAWQTSVAGVQARTRWGSGAEWDIVVIETVLCLPSDRHSLVQPELVKLGYEDDGEDQKHGKGQMTSCTGTLGKPSIFYSLVSRRI